MRYTNSSDLAAYLKGNFSYESVLPLSRKDELEETMFLGLRKSEGIILTEQMKDIYGETLERLQREGLLARQGERIFLTDRGIDVSNCVLAEFLLEEEL